MGMTGSRDKVQSQCILFVSKLIYCRINSQIYNFLILFGKKSCNEWNKKTKEENSLAVPSLGSKPNLRLTAVQFFYVWTQLKPAASNMSWSTTFVFHVMQFCHCYSLPPMDRQKQDRPQKGKGFASGCFHRQLRSPYPSCLILNLFCVLPVSLSLPVALSCTCSPIRLNRWSSFSRMVYPYVQAQGWLCRQAHAQELGGDTRRPIVT